ncbi:hypothetical protein [Acinetobacter sp. SWAC57]|uniref:hypothetical protein n=1 Tax=Acinetobacter sp. SWAC57 TaxID=2293834 RepID=UPI000E5B07A2|nr:hypothetical protein [Acinetobacter sp. SWAC57]RGD89866.1 hypothetical protein DYI96_11825 [Acinetobacter sp. SWAC57]
MNPNTLSLKQALLPLVLGGSLILTGCNKADERAEQDTLSSDDKVLQELSSEPVKNFAQTADDPHDITLLVDYDQRFSSMSDEMEDELIKMREAGTLTDEFAKTRKQDNIQSALNMLKELDLKTEQGRYIQTLMYQYWDNQAKIIQNKNATPEQNVKGLGELIHAQEQLEHWQSQYSKQKDTTATGY